MINFGFFVYNLSTFFFFCGSGSGRCRGRCNLCNRFFGRPIFRKSSPGKMMLFFEKIRFLKKTWFPKMQQNHAKKNRWKFAVNFHAKMCQIDRILIKLWSFPFLCVTLVFSGTSLVTEALLWPPAWNMYK